MAYNTGFGSANEVLGGSRFAELAPVPCGKAFHEVDTAQPRIPDLLPNPVRSSYALQSTQIDLSGLFPKPESLLATPKRKHKDPYEVYVPEGRIERLADLGLLDFADK